jgi:tetratricopeptide (TPR) repeat protein
MTHRWELRKRLVESLVLSVFLGAFLFFFAQSKIPQVFPPRWRLSLVNEELLKSAFFNTYLELLETNPDDPDANWVVGTYYGQRGECTRAVPLLERALSLGREDPSIYEWLARCYAALGDLQKARSYNERASRKSRDEPAETGGSSSPSAANKTHK